MTKTSNRMTAFENQIAKLSKVEFDYFTLVESKGIKGEEALGHVFIASATRLLK